MRSRLSELEDIFDKSGITDHQVISDGELIELRNGLKYIVDYFYDRDEHTISIGMRSKLNSVENMIRARNDY
jgi:hypothetical protein